MKQYHDLPTKSRGLFAIPLESVTSGTRCVMLEIPDSDAAERQLAGVLYELTHWNNYQREPTHKGTEWAQAWRAALMGQTLFEGCMSITFRQDLCGLYVSFDGGETEELIYDAMTCIESQGAQEFFDGLIDDAIQDLIDDGTLQRQGGQPGPEATPDNGGCKTYHVILRGADRWRLPMVVNAGDTLHITNPVGGWTDGAFLWYCYDGKSYVLGTCGNNNAYQPGDPIQSGNHMRVIGGYDTTTPVYFDPLTALYTVPSGVVNKDAWLQANDGTLSDNQGQIEFDIEHCVNAQTATHNIPSTNGTGVLYFTTVNGREYRVSWPYQTYRYGTYPNRYSDGFYTSDGGSWVALQYKLGAGGTWHDIVSVIPARSYTGYDVVSFTGDGQAVYIKINDSSYGDNAGGLDVTVKG